MALAHMFLMEWDPCGLHVVDYCCVGAFYGTAFLRTCFPW